MPVSKFKFVSPGVQVAEIDNSQLPKIPSEMGPVIFGRAARGPALRPVRVDSFSEFIEIFGAPKGGGEGTDVWRNGGTGLAPTYGVYAAQAYLRNSSPVTFVRLLGRAHEDATAAGVAGWVPRDALGQPGLVALNANRSGGGYGLFVIDEDGTNPGGTVGVDATASFDLWITGTDGAGIVEENITLSLTDCEGRTITYRTAFDAIPAFPTSSTLYAVDLSAFAPTPTVQEYMQELTSSINRSSNTDLSSSLTASINNAEADGSGSVFLHQQNTGCTTNCNSAFGGNLYPQNVTCSIPGCDITVADFGPFAGGTCQTTTAATGVGTLAAIFYLTTGSMLLRGVDQHNAGGGNIPISGTSTFVRQNAAGLFEIDIMDTQGAATPSETLAFDLYNENSKNYVRKVFNTNPTVTNFGITPVGGARKNYWLGESYNRMATEPNSARFAQGTNQALLGILLPMMSGSAHQQSEHTANAQKAETPYIISQDIGGTIGSYSYQELFKFVTLEVGEWEQQNFKISISNVKSSTDPFNAYGTFTVELRMADDSDNTKQIVEQFSLCNLNPNSNNYVAKKIGDMYAVWDDRERRYREYGNNSNQSKYFRVKMNTDVDNAATNADYLPFGFEAPLRFGGFTLEQTGAVAADSVAVFTGSAGFEDDHYVAGAVQSPDNEANIGVVPGGPYDAVMSLVAGATLSAPTCSFVMPMTPLRQNTQQGRLSSPKDAYFGIDTTMGTSTRFEPSFMDMGRSFPSDFDSWGDVTLPVFEMPYIFTLEDLSRWDALTGGTLSANDAYYLSGSRASALSISSTASAATGDVNGWNGVLRAGFNQFTVPLQGGFDGLDITEVDPFRNTQELNGQTELTSYAFNSVKMAIDTCADPEVVECNMMTMPALTNTALTEHIIKTCEDRADALAIIDIENGYLPAAENSDDEEARAGNIENAVRDLSQRGINSSYGCCYYPWVQARDSETGKTFWCPPSVAALGTFSSSQQKSELWFAPAGFNRGGLTAFSAGIPIMNVKQKLTSQDRDDLYEVNINPIASFPAEGIVIFGQKTLQTTQSALDRVNVRRLMIYVKKEISRMAANLLFDQNVQVTWDRFTGKVVPFLNGIMTRLGLSDFKVILDDTTTTPDLIDRNILYAKIFLKPARAIEFIAIDFVITSTGASFED